MCYGNRGIRARGSVDRATGSGPVDRGFESLRAHLSFARLFVRVDKLVSALPNYCPSRSIVCLLSNGTELITQLIFLFPVPCDALSLSKCSLFPLSTSEFNFVRLLIISSVQIKPTTFRSFNPPKYFLYFCTNAFQLAPLREGC